MVVGGGLMAKIPGTQANKEAKAEHGSGMSGGSSNTGSGKFSSLLLSCVDDTFTSTSVQGVSQQQHCEYCKHLSLHRHKHTATAL